jgi:tetratricopeptide (TPR) repeat protein/predicted Ser/Thr protein kinase
VKFLEPGLTLVDRFVVESFVGRGGMSIVYRALDRATHTPVALKFFTGRDEAIERFDREAKLLAGLSHPAIVEHIASGVFKGTRYLAMEWLDGKDLSQALAQGTLSPLETLELATVLATALGAAHRAGVIHRDIKPANIFLQRGSPSHPKLLDFGIARSNVGPRLTKHGEALGTPAYMAPEQAKGAGVTSAADVFSLGCVLFECLSGKPPFWADHPLAVMAKILLEDAPKLADRAPSAPAALAQLIDDMLAKEPDSRPPDGSAVFERLEFARSALGHPSAEPQSHTSTSLTTHERKLLSVLFVGNVPESPAERLRTTEVTQVSPSGGQENELFYADVMAHGGWAERLIDGTIVVTMPGSGVPIEQAARAARCALAIRRTLPSSLVVLATGRADLTGGFPVGEVIDRGVKMLNQALNQAVDATSEEVGVLVDGVTAGLLDQRFDVAARLGNFQVLAESTLLEAGTLLGRASTFVGREREIERVSDVLATSAVHQCSQALLILAPAGVGKSRLASEMVSTLVAQSGATVAWARAHTADRHVPLRVAARLLSVLIGLVDNESQTAMRQRVRARVGRNLTSSHLDRVASFLGELLGVRFDGEAHPLLPIVREDPIRLGDHIRAAFGDFLQAELAAGPLVLAIDDIHHSDPASVALIDSALKNFRNSPLLIIGLARPEVDSVFPDLWQNHALLTLALQPLSPVSARKLIEQALENADSDAIERIITEAAGNALHLEELVRAFHEGRDGKLPETVMGMVQVRLEALPPDARRVLRACSILEDSFSLSAVKALVGDRSDEVENYLERMVRSELLSVTAPSNAASVFSFRSATIREAAYESLTEEDRRLGHRLAADWLEEYGSTREAVLVAHHREKSSQGEKAISWYARAAEVALEANDLRAVIERANRGLSLRAEGSLRGRLCILLAEAHRHLGENAQLFARAHEALALLVPFSPTWWIAYANTVLASIRLGKSELVDELSALLETTTLRDLPADAARAAHYLFFAGKDGAADTILRVAMQHIGPFAEDPAKWAWGYRAHATHALLTGNTGDYLTQLDMSVTAFEAAGDYRNVASEKVNLGFAHAELGLYEESLAILGNARTLAVTLQLRHVIGAADSNIGAALARLGKFEQALLVFHRTNAEFAIQGNKRMEGNTRNYLARALLRLGQFAEADRESELAVELLEAVPTLQPSARATRARVLLARGHHEDALRHAANALSALEVTGKLDEGEAYVRLVFAEVTAASGNRELAYKAILAGKERLLARASAIHQEHWRRSFLEQVEENRRTFDLAGTLLG